MFIEKMKPLLIGESPFMGERPLVALLKELLSLNWDYLSINISPLRGFFRHTRSRVLGSFWQGLNFSRLFSVVKVFAQDRMAIEFIEDLRTRVTSVLFSRFEVARVISRRAAAHDGQAGRQSAQSYLEVAIKIARTILARVHCC